MPKGYYIRTKAICKNISKSLKGRKLLNSHKENISKKLISLGLCKGKNNGMFGKKHSKDSIEKIKKNRSGKCLGKDNFKYGKKPIWYRYLYNKIKMRSSWEVKYAKYLDFYNIKWLYESKTFDLGNHTYTPDFYLPKTNQYIEIKGWWKNHKNRFLKFKRIYPNIKIKLLQFKELKSLGVL